MPYNQNILSAPGGTTGTATHASVPIPAQQDNKGIDFAFVVEAVGATPTITYKYQLSADDPTLADGSSTFVDMNYVTDASDTAATAARAVTAVGVTHQWIAYVAAAENRKWKKVRLVTSANTNVTYHGELRCQLSSNQ